MGTWQNYNWQKNAGCTYVISPFSPYSMLTKMHLQHLHPTLLHFNKVWICHSLLSIDILNYWWIFYCLQTYDKLVFLFPFLLPPKKRGKKEGRNRKTSFKPGLLDTPVSLYFGFEDSLSHWQMTLQSVMLWIISITSITLSLSLAYLLRFRF